MLSIPAQLSRSYKTFIKRKGVRPASEKEYLKWLRFYLDFCHKYAAQMDRQQRLVAFLEKLKSKNQPEKQRKLAQHAVKLYFESGLSGNNQTVKNDFDRYSKKLPPQSTPEYSSAFHSGQPATTFESKLSTINGDWNTVYNQLKNEIAVRHYAPSTLKTYSCWVRKFEVFTKSKHPEALDTRDVKEFLSWLAVKQKVSASSQNQAFNALLFVYRHIFHKEFGQVDGVVRAKRKPYIPVVLSREEVFAILTCLEEPYRLIVSLMYGCGLRISECLSLRVQNFNFDHMVLTIHDGKGKKDRTVPLPEKLIDNLRHQLKRLYELHDLDCREQYDGVFLYGQLEKKYRNAAKEFVWQWFFPAKGLTVVTDTGERKRYHVHTTVIQKAIRRAVRKAKVPKRVTAHTFRHSYASHLLQANYDIRTIQEMLGHSDVRTTMMYTHTVKSVTVKEAKSPLDF